jgi:hypothetical protein
VTRVASPNQARRAISAAVVVAVVVETYDPIGSSALKREERREKREEKEATGTHTANNTVNHGARASTCACHIVQVILPSHMVSLAHGRITNCITLRVFIVTIVQWKLTGGLRVWGQR